MSADQPIAIITELAPYGRLPESLILNPAVTADECRLYALLTTYDYKQEHECWPSQATLAKRMGVSDRSIRRMVANLSQHGAIEVIRQRRAPARIVLLADVERTALAGQESKSGQIDAQERPNPGSVPLTNESERTRAVPLFDDDELARDFDAWWPTYPRKIARKAALKAYRARRREGVTARELAEARDHYAAAVKATEVRFVMHPATFLGAGDRWRDYAEAPAVEDERDPNPANWRWFDDQEGTG